MRDIRVTAPFEKIHEPHQVAFHISVGVYETVTDARLGGQVYYPVKCMIGKKPLHPLPVRHIQADKAKRAVRFEPLKASFFEAHIVVTVQIVKADDLVAVSKETSAQMKTDKPRGSGNEDTTLNV